MKQGLPLTSATTRGLLVLWLIALPGLAWAASLPGTGTPPGTAPVPSPKDEAVKKYIQGCRSKPVKDANCDKLRKEAVEILKDDLHTLGSSANRKHLTTLLKIFKKNEPELRIAAADAIGMIGPLDSDAEFLAPLANDPVPDVRRAVSQLISRGKGNSITLLGQRTMSMRAGLAPEVPADPGKYSLPVAPESTYLFFGSDAAAGRLSYVTKGMDGTTAFFKGKAKKGPFKLEEFQERYRFQLQDEQQAREKAQDEKGKQLEHVKPDPTNPKALMEFMEKAQSVQSNGITMMLLDSYDAKLFGSPSVYILEERQIGQRSYPTRYVVLYQDQALKRPGYRLSWMTVPDNAIKTAQAVSLVEEKEEAGRKKEDEALKKRGEALEDLVKKKDEQEKKNFKKGQADLEKELGF
jgi:HEAT repeat protein